MTKVAIQGAKHSFHYIVSKKMLNNIDEYIFCDTFSEVFEAVNKDKVDYGIVATHNSAFGEIKEVSQLRKQYADFKVLKKYTLRVELHLLGIKGASLKNVTDIYSQLPALVASKAFLASLNASIHEYNDTAAAADFVANSGDKTKAAIASESAAKDYGLEIIKRNTETVENYTDFILLGKYKTAPF